MKQKMTRLTSVLLAVIMLLSVVVVPVSATETFKDVPANKWYSEAVEYVAANGMMNGVSSDLFDPDGTVTRAMFVTVLARLAKVELDNSVTSFADVPAGKWYTGAVTWAKENGIANGVSSSSFAPMKAINRQDMCAMLARFINVMNYELPVGEEKTFTDAASIARYAREAVATCTKVGLIAGYDDGTFRPAATTTRAQMAVIMMRLDKAIKGETEEPVPMPAQSFNVESDGMIVKVNAPEGALPEGSEMIVERVTNEDALAAIASRVNSNVFAAADISFFKDETEIEPEAEVEVQIDMEGLENVENPTVIHIADDGNLNGVESEMVSTTRGGHKVLRFSVKDFSVYAIIENPDVPGDDYPYRATYEFYDFNGEKYYFADAAGNLQYTQILKDGEILEDVGSPMVTTQNTKFAGWFVWNGTSMTEGTYGEKCEVNEAKTVTGNTTIKLKAKAQGFINVMFVSAVMEDDQGLPMSRSVVTVKQVDYTVGQTEPITVVTSDVTTEAPTADKAVVGWNQTASDADQGIAQGSPITLFANGNAENIRDVTLFPAVKKTHWLYFDENDGGTGGGASYTPPQFVQIGDKPTEPTPPHRTGYTFGGWYKDAACTQAFDFDVPLDQTRTVYAKWNGSQTTYTIIVKVQSTSDSAKITSANNLAHDAKTYDFWKAYTVDNVQTGGTATVANNYKQLANQIDTSGYIIYETCDPDTTIAADGSTVLYVYYQRQVMTIHWRNTQNGSDRYTWYGLYGASFADSGKTWIQPDSGYQWRTSATLLTFMDAFKDFNPAGTSLVIYRTQASTSYYDIYFYTEELDGSWKLDQQFDFNATSFQFREKYDAFSLYAYSRDGSNWYTAVSGNSVNRNNQDLYVLFQRNTYDIEFHNGTLGTEGTVVKVEQVKYDDTLDDSLKPGVTYPVEEDAGHYDFIGWFADSGWKVLVTFTELDDQTKANYRNWYGVSEFVVISKMPSHNFPLYAGYALKGWDCALDPNGGEFTSNTQAGVFWLEYGGKFSSDLKTNIQREGYIFQGWMVASVEGALDIVTRNNLRYVGDDSNWTMSDKPWEFSAGIEGPTYLMAKWFLKTVMHVEYDINGGYGEIVDTGEYSDHATTVAFSAPRPPANKFFLGWDIVGTDTVEKILPGYTFEVNSDYATNGTVTLKAVYGSFQNEGEEIPVTHIDWYANNKTVAEYVTGKDDEGNDIKETLPTHVTNAGIQMNEGVAIKASNTFENPGFTFLGWAKLHKDPDSGKILDHNNKEVDATRGTYQDYNLTEENLFLKYDAENKTFLAEYKNEENEIEWVPVSQVAADENLPYDDMYAVWSREYFFVFHSESGKLQAFDMPVSFVEDEGNTGYGHVEKATIHLTDLVPDHYLYGGYYMSYGGVDAAAVKDKVSEFATKGASGSGWAAASTYDLQTAEVDMSSDESYKFDQYTGDASLSNKNNRKFWSRANAYGGVVSDDQTVYPGSALIPEAGKVYYLKEVPETYLTTKYLYTYNMLNENKIEDFFMLTVMDDSFYKTIGFRTNENADTNDLAAQGEITPMSTFAGTFKVTQKGNEIPGDPHCDPVTVTVNAETFGLTRGYIAVTRASNMVQQYSDFSVMPVWTTLDGVDVNSHGALELEVDAAKTTVSTKKFLGGAPVTYNELFINTTNATWWDSADAETRIYFFNVAEQKNEWVLATKIATGIFKCQIPSGNWEKFVVVRGNKAYVAPDSGPDYWSDGTDGKNGYKFNQTVDVTLDRHKNQVMVYDYIEWNNGSAFYRAAYSDNIYPES